MYAGLGMDKVFQQQSSLIAKVNRKLTPKFFANYVPNYKDIATLQQIFGDKTSIPARMLMERQTIEKMTVGEQTLDQINEKIDKYVVHSYLNAFNKKYSDLLENQKSLLKKYMTTTEDDNTDFVVFLNEELQNISSRLNTAHNVAEIKEDKEILKKLVEVKKRFNALKDEDIDEKYLQKILKFQKLVNELEN
jgi:chorismate mutase